MLVCALLLLAGKLCKWSSSKMVKKIKYLNLTWLESSHFLSLGFLLQHPQEVDEERLLEPTYFFHKAYLFFLCVLKKKIPIKFFSCIFFSCTCFLYSSVFLFELITLSWIIYWYTYYAWKITLGSFSSFSLLLYLVHVFVNAHIVWYFNYLFVCLFSL